MKLALIIPIYKRHDLTKIVINRFVEQSKKYGFGIVIAGSEGEVSKELAQGLHYIETENNPLGKKQNTLLKYAKELGFTSVVMMGSDNIVEDKFFDEVLKLSDKTKEVHGTIDFYFYRTIDKKFGLFKGYRNGKQLGGAGRFYSNHILNQVDWVLWDEKRNSGLDSSVDEKLFSKGIGIAVMDVFLMDVKHTTNITPGAIVDLCIPEKLSYMGKKIGEKTAKEVTALETVKEVEEVITDDSNVMFESNGVYKQMGTNTYEMPRSHASILVKKGFGKIIK